MGKMPYKGFYELEDARKEAAKLREKDLDVWIRGVEAFSTLGFFKDPLISYMRSYSVYDLANLIIHEQTHATVWKKGDTNFNEDLASFVGDIGARLFVSSRYGADSKEFLDIDNNERNTNNFREDVLKLRAELEVFYNGLSEDLSAEERQAALEKKQAIIKDFQNRFLETYDERYVGENYRGFAELAVNNAYIDLYQIYHGSRSWFDEQYDAVGGDIKKFIAAMKLQLKK